MEGKFESGQKAMNEKFESAGFGHSKLPSTLVQLKLEFRVKEQKKWWRFLFSVHNIPGLRNVDEVPIAISSNRSA